MKTILIILSIFITSILSNHIFANQTVKEGRLQKILVFLINFKEDKGNQPWSNEVVEQLFFQRIKAMFAEYSYGQMTIQGSVAGWYTLPTSTQIDCNHLIAIIHQTAISAAVKANVSLEDYQHQFFIFPKVPQCDWVISASTLGNPTVSFINGNLTAGSIAHALGHNFGLMHANLAECNDANYTHCRIFERKDYADPMGEGNTTHFNSLNKEKMGFLKYPQIQEIDKTGIYVLYPLALNNEQVKALKIFKGHNLQGKKEYYYLEYRQPLGYDKQLKDWNVGDFTEGILIHAGNADTINYQNSLLVDANLNNTNKFNVALLPGKTFIDLNSRVIIYVINTTTEKATIRVHFLR